MKQPEKNPEDFHKGDGVVYLPTKEDGIVTSTTANFVFVNFDPLKPYGVACYAGDLELQAEHL